MRPVICGVSSKKPEMEHVSTNKKLLFSIAILFIVSSIAIAAYKHDLILCTLIEYSEYEEIIKGVFVSPDTTEEQKYQLLALLEDARKRIKKTYGDYTASPIVISSHNMEELKKYTNNNHASTKFTTDKAYVVLGEDGHNLDVVSHELVHAELFSRVGYFNRTFKIPVWFEEGIAMQVDLRGKYDKPPTTKKEITQLKYSWQFFKGDDDNLTAHYSLAKDEVKNWLSGSGEQALYKLLDEIKNGKDFDELYNSAREKS